MQSKHRYPFRWTQRASNIRLILFVTSLLLVGCQSPSSSEAELPDYWPTEGWRTDAPANRGLDENALASLTESLDNQLPYLDSLLIIRNGYLVYEQYRNGYTPTSLHDIASVTKSWTSALVGMAQTEGNLSDLDAPLPELLPDYFVGGAHADKTDITLRHLLMMRSGLEFDEAILDTGGYGGEEVLEKDTTAFALDFPMAYPAGEAWNYGTINTQLISAIFQEAMGESLASFAAANLFAPLGITEFDWLADESGITIGGQNLSMAPSDMAKLGLLYLHGGRWDGEQLIPAEWVARSLTPQGDVATFGPTGEEDTIEWYGYHWWIWKPDWFQGYRSFHARGYGGQWVLVFPELDLIVVTTTTTDGVDPTAADEQEAAVGEMINDQILPTLTDVDLQ